MKHILWLEVRETTVLTVLKSFLSNVYQRQEGCRRAEDGKILILGEKNQRCYSRMTSKQSIQFFRKLLIIKYASNMQYVDAVSCLWFPFNRL